MARLLLYLPSAALRESMQRALRIERTAGARHVCGWVGSIPDLWRSLREMGWEALILDPVDNGVMQTELIQRISSEHPSVELALYGDFSAVPAQLVLNLAPLGVRWIVTHGLDDDPPSLARGLSQSLAQGPLDALAARISDRSSPVVGSVFRRALSHSHGPLTVTQLSGLTGIRHRALRRLLRSAGLPSPATLIAWCRIFHATRLFGDPTRSADAVARDLGFSSPSDLRRRLKRLTNKTPTQVLIDGGVAWVIDLFEKQIPFGRTMSDSDMIDADPDTTPAPSTAVLYRSPLESGRRLPRRRGFPVNGERSIPD